MCEHKVIKYICSRNILSSFAMIRGITKVYRCIDCNQIIEKKEGEGLESG